MTFGHHTPAVNNHPEMTDFARSVIQASPGLSLVEGIVRQMTVSDDFSEFLQRKPGSYVLIGNGENGHPLHHPKYDFNDEILLPGAQLWVNLVKSYLDTPKIKAAKDIDRNEQV
nr:M20/M25/M40 family metallo-hydrolase [Ruegeria arenilitoris]